MKNYIVYTEILNDEIERWYYGTYDQNTANEVALRLGNDFPTFHCVCEADEAVDLGIRNLPN